MEGFVTLNAHMTESGYPDWITTDKSRMGEFEVERYVDLAAEQLEIAREQDKKSTPPRGQQMRVTWTPPSEPPQDPSS